MTDEKLVLGDCTLEISAVCWTITGCREHTMSTQVSPTPEIRQEILGAIPIIKYYCDRLRIVECIDLAVPSAPQSIVTHGECVLALLISVLQGDHRLCYVQDKLADVDLERLFCRPGIEASHFNDTRLGEALDALHTHTTKVYGNIVVGALRAWRITPKRFHVDTTSVVLQGLYEVLEVLPALREGTPIPEHGYSKDHRPDLLQLMFGMVNTEEGIPILGRFESGNKSDVKLFRNYMGDVACMLEDIRGWDAIMIGDSKLCTVETMMMAAELELPMITLMPETFSIHREFVESAAADPDLPVLFTTEDGETYHGKSFRFPAKLEKKGRDRVDLWLRVLAVHSSQMAERKAVSRAAMAKKEARSLESMRKKLEAMSFACQEDAEQVTAKRWAEAKAKYHTMTMTVRSSEIVAKSPGRPKTKANSLPETKVVWHVDLAIQGKPKESFPFDPDGFFVLITTVMDKRVQSDAKLLASYKEQYVVETSFKWLKGPLAVAPVFLQLPSRIQSLGFVLLLAILFAALLQRDARRALAKRGGKIPNYPGRKSDKPTWQGIIALFEKIGLTRVAIEEQEHVAFHRLEADQMEVLALLGLDKIYQEYSNHVYT